MGTVIRAIPFKIPRRRAEWKPKIKMCGEGSTKKEKRKKKYVGKVSIKEFEKKKKNE